MVLWLKEKREESKPIVMNCPYLYWHCKRCQVLLRISIFSQESWAIRKRGNQQSQPVCLIGSMLMILLTADWICGVGGMESRQCSACFRRDLRDLNVFHNLRRYASLLTWAVVKNLIMAAARSGQYSGSRVPRIRMTGQCAIRTLATCATQHEIPPFF